MMTGEKEPSPTAIHSGSVIGELESLFSKLEGAYSQNSLRAYRSDLRIYTSWCQAKAVEPFPASPEVVAAFLESEAERHAAATVSRRLAAIARAHRALGHWPITGEPGIYLAMRRIKRRLGTRQDQVLGITSDLLRRLLDACPSDMHGVRDALLLSLGYDTLCRRSELVSLRFEDIRRSCGARSGAILVRKSKADPFGQGRLAYLSERSLAFLDIWQSQQGQKQRLILSSVQPIRDKDEGLHPASVARILKVCGRRAGLPEQDVKRVSGHSLRIGAAQDMAAAGIGLPAIMQAGGWRSPSMVLRYIENLEVSQSGMAQLTKIRQNPAASFNL